MHDERQPTAVEGPRRLSSVGRKGLFFVALLTSALTSPFLENEATSPDRAVTAAQGPAAPAPSTTARTPFPTAPPEPPPVAIAAGDSVRLAPAVRLSNVGPASISPEYIVHDVGCADDLSAGGLARFFAEPLGAIEGFDGPRLYPLGDGRTLWILQDTFVDYADAASSFAFMDYANSTALIQDGRCFTSLQRGTATHAESFEQGVGEITFDRYFWPGGGTVKDGKLQMFWMEMVRDPAVGGPFDGISLHPRSTWLATYDARTLQRLDFRPAPNAGVSPVYGYTVVDDGAWSYLFGNTYQQNLALEGGYPNGPHSATNMYLARVPLGRLSARPVYWDGAGWSSDAARAEPISSRFWTENSMLPVVVDGRWISATKVDGFLGNGITIDVADDPWGPWLAVDLLPAVPRGDPAGMVTYHALVLPWTEPDGDLIVSLSQIPLALGADDAPPKYRPNFVAVPAPDRQ